MHEELKIFDKAASIIEFRRGDGEYNNIHDRLSRLKASFSENQTDYQTNIIRKACDDILRESPVKSEPHFSLQEHVIEEIEQIPDEDLSRYLFYRYRYNVFPQTKQLDDFPPCLQIEPASICNYRCVFCYQTDKELTDPKNGHMGLMSLNLFKKVIDQAEGKCEAVTLASRGEPLICRDIEEMLDYASSKFLALKINTNAWFLDERMSHAILQANVNILVISADAASEPLYSRLRVNGKLERVLTNVKRFQEIRAQHYPTSRTITRVSGVKFCNDQHLDEMEDIWGNLVDQIAFVAYNPWENTYQRPLNDITTSCSDLWRRMFVWFDGTVNPCDIDYNSTLAVGNTQSETLSEIWRSQRYEVLRDAHLNRRRSAVSPCNRCTLV